MFGLMRKKKYEALQEEIKAQSEAYEGRIKEIIDRKDDEIKRYNDHYNKEAKQYNEIFKAKKNAYERMKKTLERWITSSLPITDVEVEFLHGESGFELWISPKRYRSQKFPPIRVVIFIDQNEFNKLVRRAEIANLDNTVLQDLFIRNLNEKFCNDSRNSIIFEDDEKITVYCHSDDEIKWIVDAYFVAETQYETMLESFKPSEKKK